MKDMLKNLKEKAKILQQEMQNLARQVQFHSQQRDNAEAAFLSRKGGLVEINKLIKELEPPKPKSKNNKNEKDEEKKPIGEQSKKPTEKTAETSKPKTEGKKEEKKIEKPKEKKEDKPEEKKE